MGSTFTCTGASHNGKFTCIMLQQKANKPFMGSQGRPVNDQRRFRLYCPDW